MAKVTRSNPKAFETLNASLRALSEVQLKVGWFESAKYENGTPVAVAAAVNETGAPGKSIPPRPFFRPTISAKQQDWFDKAGEGAKAVLDGKATAVQVMGQLGFVIQEDVKETINNIYSPILSPITIMARKLKKLGWKITGKTIGYIAGQIAAGKGDFSGVSTKPLIDTHLMIDTLTNVVEKA